MLSPSSPMLSPSSPMLSPSSPMLSVDSRVLASFRVPFVGGTIAIAHNRVKADPFKTPPTDLGIMGGVTGLAIGIIAGLSLCAMIKTAQFNHCATNGDSARIAQCARWLR